LSPTNVLIGSTGTVRLVDFEAACEIGVDPLAILFTPGFASADHITSDLPQVENDYFGLGALMFAYFMPIHAALGLDPSIHERFVRSIGNDIGLPENLLELITSLMSREPSERPKPARVIEALENPKLFGARDTGVQLSDEAIRKTIAGAMNFTLSQATPDRGDRLFPCDPKIFATNSMNLAYGTSGIAYSLKTINGSCPEWVAGWMLRQQITTDTYAPGLYIGMAGIAWTMLELGLTDAAKKVLASSADHPLLRSSSDIFYGLAGWGMTQLRFHLTLGGDEYLNAAIEAGRHL